VVGVGLAAGTAALGANVRAERAAAANTGLFVTVKDVENPKWRIEMRDDGIQARWMEILTQDLECYSVPTDLGASSTKSLITAGIKNQ